MFLSFKKGNKGDLALDEIQLIQNKPCGPFIDIKTTFKCDFENDSCGFTNSSDASNRPWYRTKYIGNKYFYPQRDNTLRTSYGSFLELDIVSKKCSL